MNKKTTSGKYRTVFVLSFFALALVIIGIFLRTRIGTLMASYTENQTAKQAMLYGMLMEEKLGTELENLEYIASKLEDSLDDMDELMPHIYNETGIEQGLLSIDGEALYGDPLDPAEYEGIQHSFRGNKVITYASKGGILFTCPVFNGSNIRYVLYRLVPESALESTFATAIYDDRGKACVATRYGEVVIPFYGSSAEDSAWFQSDDIQRKLASMHREMEVSVAVAKCFPTDRGDMVLFESEIPGTDFLVSGFVPNSVASEGIGRVTILVVWVFGLLMLLVMIGAFYLSRTLKKARESDELRAAKAEAEEASRAKGDFLANMSHEIRTPINSILGMNEMILRESEDENILTYAESVKGAGNTLLGLINDILDFSKIDAGKIEIIPTEYDLSAVLYDMVNLVRSRADEKGLLIRLDFDSSMPRRLKGDEVRVRQVITNILTNAVKYTEKGSITFSVGYEKAEEGNIFLKVSVSDTGIGIRPEDMEKLFSKFDRIEEKRNRNIEGTGLGMAITENLLELMGSRLQVESEYGKGSVFHFSLIQGVCGEEELGDYEKAFHSRAEREKYHESFIAPSARVLVVDDNPMNLVVFNSLVKKTMVKTDNANSGDEGLALMDQNAYDVIFLDHMMPEKDGIETLLELKAQKEGLNLKTPVICLTANAISGAREMYLTAGFDDYLTKPINADKLEAMLRSFLPEEKVEKTETSLEGTPSESENAALPPELQELSEEPWIDVKTGIHNSGSLEAYLPLLRIFYSSLEEKAKELEQFYEAADFQNYTIKVHALKSSARIIGAEAFGEEAQKLENAGKNQDADYIHSRHKEFLEEYRSFREPLEKVFGTEEEDTDKPEAEESLIKNALERLGSAADDMDCDALLEIFDEMEQYRIPENYASLWKKLKAAADQYDYEAVTELLK